MAEKPLTDHPLHPLIQAAQEHGAVRGRSEALLDAATVLTHQNHPVAARELLHLEKAAMASADEKFAALMSEVNAINARIETLVRDAVASQKRKGP